MVHLTRDSTQTFDSWVVTVKERAAECKFPADFYEQAVRDKLTFSCKEDSYKLKLYDEGAALPLDRTVQILSLKEATKRELQELKTAEIESIAKRGIAPNGENTVQKGNKADPENRPFQSSGKNCGYCNRQHTTGRRNCPAATTRCIKCNKTGYFPEICRSTPVNLVSQV